MQVVSEADVQHVAHLARLRLTEAEMQTFCAQLNDILSYVQQLQAIPTGHVEPTSHPLRLTNVMRPDATAPSVPPQEVLSLAPASHGQCVKVPKVVDV